MFGLSTHVTKYQTLVYTTKKSQHMSIKLMLPIWLHPSLLASIISISFSTIVKTCLPLIWVADQDVVVAPLVAPPLVATPLVAVPRGMV